MENKIKLLITLSLALILTSSAFLAISFAQTEKYFFTVTCVAKQPLRDEYGDLLKAEFAKIGINYQVEAYEMSVWLDRYTKMRDEKLLYEDGGADMMTMLRSWQTRHPTLGYAYYFYSGGTAQHMTKSEYPDHLYPINRWFNPRFNSLNELADTTTDEDERLDAIMEQNKILFSPEYGEFPEVPMMWMVWQFPMIEEIENFIPLWAGGDMGTFKILEVEGKTQADDVTLVGAITGATRFVSGFFPGGITELWVTENMYDSLIDFDENWNPDQPGLAESWDISSDGLTYTFHLREGVEFHNGEPFTSEDVKWTYETYINPETAANYRSHVAGAPVTSVETPDDFTVVFNLEKPTSTFLARMTLMPIESKATWEGVAPGDMTDHPINLDGAGAAGTGPYKLGEWDKDSFLTLEANEDWWGGEPFVDTIITKFIPEAGTALAALEAGEVDFLHYTYGPSLINDMQRLEDSPDFKVVQQEAPMTEQLGINCNHPGLGNPWVRRAINLIIPREHICDNILQGAAEPAEQIIPPWSWAHDPDLPAPETDVDQALEYMKLAGYDIDTLEGAAEATLETWLYPAIAGLVIGLICGAGAVYLIKRKPQEE
jgi:ABC-type transport system substrate-binding protein